MTTSESADGSFVWPYSHPPYDIQVSFMKAMKETLDRGHCGIFESPTGTGKTSSIICSVVPWIMHNWNKRCSKSKGNSEKDEPSWMIEHEQEMAKRDIERIRFLRKRRDERFLQHEKNSKGSTMSDLTRKVRRIDAEKLSASDSDDSESDDEEASDRNEESQEMKRCRKLYFCSRTHSQLAQFLAEVKRVFPNNEVTAITLGSRSQLCVNEELKKKVKDDKLNDACLDMQDGTSSQKCPYLSDQKKVTHLADAQLHEITDVEDLVSMGKEKEGCAYYAAREASKNATIIALPYAALLSQSTREALGIDVEGDIIVCDEAHNLIDAVAEMHTCQLTIVQLTNALAEMKAYLEKYSTRFNADNKSFLAELSSVVTKLTRYVEKSTSVGVLSLEEFMQNSRIGDNNIFEIVRKANEAQLNKKLKGVAKEMQHENTSIQAVITFLGSLKASAEDARVCLTPGASLKFLLLNPGATFASIVEKAHAVILAGGTMHPIDDVIEQLFTSKSGNQRQVDVFSCGHVIGGDRLKALQVSLGPSQKELCLTFETRQDAALMDEIGNCLRNICTVCPDGLVVFLPSYTFQDSLMQRWESTGLLATFRKPVVREMRSKAKSSGEKTESDTTFAEYEKILNSNSNGCMLIAVVGGKLSEGINFCDHLARCVVMVGMPYPNRHEPELAARMDFVEAHFGKGAGTRFFENKCWKAVNQSVGRSIRHKNDFACVVFLDVRYSQSEEKLPRWIAENFDRCANWGKLMAGLASFFRTKPKRIM